MTRTRTLLSLGLLLLAVPARAQESSTPATPIAREKAEDTFHEVERGFFIGAGAGPSFIVNPPALPGGKRPFSPGQMAQVELGVDLGSALSVSAFLTGSSNRAGSDYVGQSTSGAYSGDFSALVPGASVRLNFAGLEDAYGTRRTWFYVRAGAGVSFFSPKQLLPQPEFLVFAGPGVEYYTRLRHFSIGVELTGSYLVSSGSFGFALTPNLRYAF